MDKKEIAQGTKSNATGNTLEQMVKSVFLQKGFRLISFKEWESLKERLSGNFLITNANFKSIYGHKGKTEFLLRSEKFPGLIRIECKWQQSAGSVDEKLPYLYLNCIESMPENHILILIDGAGWKPGSLTWLREAVLQKKYYKPGAPEKTIQVFNLSEFLTWVNNHI